MNSLLLFMLTQNHLFLYLTALAADDDAECLRTNTVILPWCLSISWITMCSLEAEFGLCDIKWVKFWLLINTMSFYKCPNWGKVPWRSHINRFFSVFAWWCRCIQHFTEGLGKPDPPDTSQTSMDWSFDICRDLSLEKKHVDISHFCSL